MGFPLNLYRQWTASAFCWCCWIETMMISLGIVVVAAEPVEDWRTSPRPICCRRGMTNQHRRWPRACRSNLQKRPSRCEKSWQNKNTKQINERYNRSTEALMVSSYCALSSSVSGFSSSKTRFKACLSWWRSACRLAVPGQTKFHADGRGTNCWLMGWLTFQWDLRFPRVAIHL